MGLNYNKTVLGGRVVNEPEVRPAGASGSTVAKFRMAVGRQKKNPQTGQWESVPNSQLYIDVEAWHRPDQKRNLCDVIQRFVQKGREVLVDGSLVTDEWEDKNGGGKRSKIKLVVDNLELIGGRDDNPSESGASQGAGGRQEQAPQQTGYGQPAGYGDDSQIPF